MRHMTLDARAIGTAAGLMAAALTTACAFGIAVAPLATKEMASILFHLDLDVTSRSVSWGAYFGSLVGWTFGTGLVVAGVARLYNRLTRETAPAQEREPGFAWRASGTADPNN